MPYVPGQEEGAGALTLEELQRHQTETARSQVIAAIDRTIAEFGGIREAGRVMSMKMCFKPYMYDPSLEGMLGKINIPNLIVWGADDRIVPVECAHQFQRAIPDARLTLIEQCGHFAHLDRPDETARVIRDFLQLQLQPQR